MLFVSVLLSCTKIGASVIFFGLEKSISSNIFLISISCRSSVKSLSPSFPVSSSAFFSFQPACVFKQNICANTLPSFAFLNNACDIIAFALALLVSNSFLKLDSDEDQNYNSIIVLSPNEPNFENSFYAFQKKFSERSYLEQEDFNSLKKLNLNYPSMIFRNN